MRARTVYLAFSLLFFLSMYFRTFFAVIGPNMSRELALTPVEFGFLSSAFFASFAAFQIPVGLMFDRFGCRTPMVVLTALGVMGAALMAAATSFLTATIGHAMLGIGCSPALMGVYFYYGRTQPWKTAARTATAIAAIGSLGALMSATPLEFAVSSIGWRYTAGVSTICLAVSAFLVGVCVPSVDKQKDSDKPVVAPDRTNRRFLLLLAPIFMSASLGTVFRSAWASPFLINVVETTSQQAANIFAVMSAAGTAASFMLPLAMRRWEPGPIIGALYISTIVLTLLLSLDTTQSTILSAVALSSLYAIGNCHTLAMAEAQSHIAAKHRGAILGALNGLGFVGVAAFSPLFGAIAKVLDQIEAFRLMFAVTAAALALSLAAYMFRTRFRE